MHLCVDVIVFVYFRYVDKESGTEDRKNGSVSCAEIIADNETPSGGNSASQTCDFEDCSADSQIVVRLSSHTTKLGEKKLKRPPASVDCHPTTVPVQEEE